MQPMAILSLFLTGTAVIYWFYRTGEINGYEQGYYDGTRRGFLKGKAAAEKEQQWK